MRRTFRWLATAAAAGITVAGAVACTSHAAPTVAAATLRAGPCGTTTTAPTYRHVIWIWFENHDVMGSSSAPFFNSIASKCGLATNYHNVTHPSLPNYVAATSGTASLEQLYSDCSPSDDCSSSAPSIFGQGETWKAYEESMPSSCDPSNSGDYAVRHNPPAYYPALTTCSANDVPYPQLATDLASNALPAFSFITPNVIDDMHDGTVAQGDTWLSVAVPALLSSDAFTQRRSLLFVTWDENDDSPGNEVATLVIARDVPAGFTSQVPYNHYSLLRTIETAWGLAPLTANDAAATAMSDFFPGP